MMRAMLMVAASLLALPAGAQQVASPPAVEKLTDPQDDYPDVSPDGRQILFQSNRSGNWQLWRMEPDGSGLRSVTANAFNDRQPAWSPDGRLVAFSSDRGSSDGKRAIFIMDWPVTANAEPRKLTSGEGQDVHPKWLGDGTGLVFNRISADGRQADVHVVTTSGRESRIDLGPGVNTYASFDRGGRWLVYRGTTMEAARADGQAVQNSDIFIARPDGSGKRRLTTDPAFDGWPAISPDGRTIAFASRQGSDRFRVFLMPIEGGETAPVPTPAGYHYTQPAWSPDGRSLIVYRWTQDPAGEVGHLVRVPLPEAAD